MRLGRSVAVAALAPALALGLSLSLSACGPADAPDDGAAESAPRVSFANLADGDTVASPLNVCLEAANVAIEPSGEVHDGAGHFHVLVDLTDAERTEFAMPGVAISKDVDPRFVHLGDGGSCKELPLDPGEHTLTAVVADGAHVTLDPPVMANVTITVQ